MKRNLLIAAVAALGAGTALAQSNVAIYGRMNTSVERWNVDGEKSSELVNNASRIGFKGSEDLGGGLNAGFQLEHGFASDTGAQSQAAFWARQSEVNLSGGFGMLRLGRMTSEAYYATADYVSLHNHDTGTSADALYAYIGRDANKISYRTPELGGLTLEVATTVKEAFRDPTYDIALNYAIGALQLGAGYERNADAAWTPGDPVADPKVVAQQFAVRALYETGPFVVGGYVQRDKNVYGAGNRTTLRLAGMYSIGNTELHANWGRAGDYGDEPGATSANQFTLAVNHNLSKRTKVYAFWTKLADKGSIYGDFSSLAAGIRHNF